MDSNIIAGLMGVGGTVLGTGIGYLLQNITERKRDNKELLRYLIMIRARFVKSYFSCETYAHTALAANYEYNYTRRFQAGIDSGEIPAKKVVGTLSEGTIENLRLIFQEAVMKYNEVWTDCVMYISEFEAYCTAEEKNELGRFLENHTKNFSVNHYDGFFVNCPFDVLKPYLDGQFGFQEVNAIMKTTFRKDLDWCINLMERKIGLR